MQKSITINNQSLSVKEYNGQRVVTFKDIDTVHGRPEGTAGRNFRSNKSHFIENVDFYKISQPDEIRRVGITSPNGGIVITQSGYLMLVKSFGDDLSWRIQRELVNTYFEAKQPYEYIEKTYRGEPVISIADFEHFSGVTRHTVLYHIKHSTLKSGKDYFLLEGMALMAFKAENPKCNRMANALYLITKSGFVKLLKIFGIKIKSPECFETKPKENNQLAIPVMKFNYKTAEVVDVPDNVKIQRAMQEIRRECEALLVVLELANKYYSPEDYEKQLFTLRELGMDVSSSICSFTRMKPNVVEKVV